MKNKNKIRGFEVVDKEFRKIKTEILDTEFDETYYKYPEIVLPERLDNNSIYSFKTIIPITLTPYQPTIIYFDVKAYMQANELLLLTTNLIADVNKHNVFNVTLKQCYTQHDYLNNATGGNLSLTLVNYSTEPIYIKKNEEIAIGFFINTLTKDGSTNG
jgi:dUTPase